MKLSKLIEQMQKKMNISVLQQDPSDPDIQFVVPITAPKFHKNAIYIGGVEPDTELPMVSLVDMEPNYIPQGASVFKTDHDLMISAAILARSILDNVDFEYPELGVELSRLLMTDGKQEVCDEIFASGMWPSKEKIIIVAHWEWFNDSRIARHMIISDLLNVFPRGVIFRYKNYAGIMVDTVTDENKKVLNDIAKEHELHIGISWPFEHIDKFVAHFNQSLACLKQAIRFGRKCAAYDYDKFFGWNLMYNYKGDIPLEDYILPQVKKIKRYDEAYGTDYINTIKAWIVHGGSAGEAAKHLYVHRNTLLYRIKGIHEKFGIDLNDTDARFKIMFSLMIDMFVNGKWDPIDSRDAE